MNILGVVPARGGSRGLPGKNIAPVAGRPLLAYTADAALASRRISRTLLSTDDEVIRAAGRRSGLDAPFQRPAEFATDIATSVAVALHALDWAEQHDGVQYDVLALLEPTAPLRTASDIDAALETLLKSDADAVVGVCRVEAPHPIKMQVIENGILRPFLPALYKEGLRRQDLSPVFATNGAIYAVRSPVLRATGSLWGRRAVAHVMPAERSVNIDTLLDLRLAEVLIMQRQT